MLLWTLKITENSQRTVWRDEVSLYQIKSVVKWLLMNYVGLNCSSLSASVSGLFVITGVFVSSHWSSVKVHLAVTILHSLASSTDRPCETGEVSHVIWHHLQTQLEVCRQRVPGEAVVKKLHLQFFILIRVMRELRFKSRRIDLRNESREQSRSKRNPVYEEKKTKHIRSEFI